MQSKAKILVIDDEKGAREALSYDIYSRGYLVETASDGEEGIEKMKKEKFDLVICDIIMPGKNGIETLEGIKQIDPDVEVIMMSGYGNIELALTAMRKGAYDFIKKPFDINEISILVEKALEKRELKTSIALYKTSKAVFSTINLDELLKIVIDMVLEILRADDTSIMLIGDDKKLYIAASHGLDDDIKTNTRLAIGERIAGKAAEYKEPIIINGPLSSDPRFAGIEGREEVKSSMICPLVFNTELIGVLNASRINITEYFTQKDLRNITIFISQIVQAIINSKLYKELKEATINLVQNEKMASLGHLTAGVAHELNQPLNSIKIICQSIIHDVEKNRFDEKSFKADLNDIVGQVDRMAEIIDHMRIYSRRTTDSPFEKIDPRISIDGVFKLFGQQLKIHNIEVIKEIPDNLPQIMGNQVELEEVFTNLISNARDAVEKSPKPDGMKIWVRAYKINGQEGRSQVAVEIEDNGSGMPEHLQRKIYEPFFTTKPPGKGTGLGLSVVHQIVERHNGRIELKTELSKGTKFTVIFPSAE